MAALRLLYGRRKSAHKENEFVQGSSSSPISEWSVPIFCPSLLSDLSQLSCTASGLAVKSEVSAIAPSLLTIQSIDIPNNATTTPLLSCDKELVPPAHSAPRKRSLSHGPDEGDPRPVKRAKTHVSTSTDTLDNLKAQELPELLDAPEGPDVHLNAVGTPETDDLDEAQRARGPRRSQEDVDRYLNAVPESDCPAPGCQEKFGGNRAANLAHLERHYSGDALRSIVARVPCIWNCGKSFRFNKMNEHIAYMHLGFTYHCPLREAEACVWTGRRGKDTPQHLKRKHAKCEDLW